MSRLLQQIRAIVRENRALRGRDVVRREAQAMLLAAAVFAVIVLDLVALSAVIGGGHG